MENGLVWIMFLKIVLENSFCKHREHLFGKVFSKNTSYYLNLVFFCVPCVFHNKKQLGINHVLPVFLVLLFENRKQFSKNEPNRYNMFGFQFVLFQKTLRTQKTLRVYLVFVFENCS